MTRRFDRQYNSEILDRDPTRGILFAASTTVPADASVGYCPGCIYIDQDASAGSQVFINEGTRASSLFHALRPEGGTFTTLTVTTLTSTTANITTVVTDAINGSAAAFVFTIKANTQHAFEFYDGTTILQDIDTRNTIANVSNNTFTASPPTIVSAAAVHKNATVEIAAKTVTYTGTNTVTSSLGAQLYINAPTFTDASAGTITTASSVHIVAVAAAGGALTITNTRMISTSVADAYLTNLGVWTDTACWEEVKEGLVRGGQKAADLIARVVGQLQPASWQYQSGFDTEDVAEDGSPVKRRLPLDDFGRERVGIVYNDLPDELRAPGEKRGVSAGLLSSFALAAIKVLWDKCEKLEKQLEGRVA